MDLKVGGESSRYWRASAAFAGSSTLNIDRNPVAAFDFRDGGPDRKRQYSVRISWNDLTDIVALLADGGEQRALLIREFLSEPEKLNEMKWSIAQLSQELSRLRSELAQKGDKLAKIHEIVIERDTRLLVHIEDLELSVRSTHFLKNAGIDDVGQLIDLSAGDLLRMPNAGRKSVNEIKEVLANMGLHLRSEPISPAEVPELV